MQLFYEDYKILLGVKLGQNKRGLEQMGRPTTVRHIIIMVYIPPKLM